MHKLMRAAVLAAFGLGIAIPSTYADANMFWKHSKVPAGEVFANTNGVAYIASDVAQAEIKKNAEDPAAPVPVAVGEKINQATNAVVFVSKGYTDSKIADAVAESKDYTDGATNETLKAAKEYADSKSGVSKEYVDDADAATLASAKSYADGATNDLKTVIEEQIQASKEDAIGAAKLYTEGATNEAVKTAKNYTDGQIGGLRVELTTNLQQFAVDHDTDVLTEATSRANTAASNTLVSAKAYTDESVSDKQDTIADLETIRSGAAAGATAVQPAAIADMETRTHAGETFLPSNGVDLVKGIITIKGKTIIPITEHQSLDEYAKTADVTTAVAGGVETARGYTDSKITNLRSVMTSADGEAMIFNEADGGGVMMTLANGTKSFVGVNDASKSATGIAGQLYVVNGTNKTKINMYDGKFCYVKGANPSNEYGKTEAELATMRDIKVLSHKVDDQKRGYSSLIYREAVNQHWVWEAVSENCPAGFIRTMNRPGAPKPYCYQPSETTFEWGGVSVFNKDGTPLYENDLTPAAKDATDITFWFTGPEGLRFQARAKRDSATSTDLVAWEFIATEADINTAIDLAQAYVDKEVRGAKTYTDVSINHLTSVNSNETSKSYILNTPDGASMVLTNSDGVVTFIGTCSNDEVDSADVVGRISVTKNKTKTKLNLYEQKICYLKNDDPDDPDSRDKHELAIKMDVTSAETRANAHAESKDSLLKEELEGKIATAEANAKAYADNIDTLKLPMKFKKGTVIYTLDVIDNGGDDISLSLVRTPAE